MMILSKPLGKLCGLDKIVEMKCLAHALQVFQNYKNY